MLPRSNQRSGETARSTQCLWERRAWSAGGARVQMGRGLKSLEDVYALTADWREDRRKLDKASSCRDGGQSLTKAVAVGETGVTSVAESGPGVVFIFSVSIQVVGGAFSSLLKRVCKIICMKW